MSWVAVGAGGIAAAGSIAGGMMGSSASKQQIKAMQMAIDYQKQKDAQTRQDLTPYREFGTDQINQLGAWLKNRDPSTYIDPGYAFRRDQANKGITSNAATAGLLQSGDTLRGLETYGQDMSSQEYNNAFNRYINEGQFKEGLASMGQLAAVGGGALANQGASNVGNLTANTNWGGPQQVWGDVATGLGGYAANAFARRYGGTRPPPDTPGGSNIFDAGIGRSTADIG